MNGQASAYLFIHGRMVDPDLSRRDYKLVRVLGALRRRT